MKTIKYTIVFLSLLVSEIGFAQNIRWNDLFDIHNAEYGIFRDAQIAKLFFEREPSKINSWKRTMQGSINGRAGEWDEMIVVYPNEQEKITFISYNADAFLKLLTLLKAQSGENAQTLPSLTTAKGTVINRFRKDNKIIEVTSAYDENIQIWICTISNENQSPNITPSNGRKVALCIGNSEYKYGNKLKGIPVNDANDIGNRLRNLGFEVIVKTDATLTDLKESVNQFINSIKQAEIGLIFYAGHGIEIDGRQYIIPVDANLKKPSDSVDSTYEIREIFTKLKEDGAKNNLIILDACRNDPFTNWVDETRNKINKDIIVRGDTNRGFSILDVPKTNNNVYLAMATGWKNVSQQKSGMRNGFYTEALLKNLKKGETIDQVFDKTGVLVKTLTGNFQNPQFLKELSIESNFVF